MATNKRSKLPKVVPLPCPFCGEHLIDHNDHHGDWFAHRDEAIYCIVGHIQLLDDEDVNNWNKRVKT